MLKQIFKSPRVIMLFALSTIMIYGFWGMFERAAYVFSNEQEDMSFGWYVPLFSLYVLWTERRKILESVGKPSWAGLLACVPCMAVALLGTRGLQLRFEQLGFIGLFVAIPWAFFGKRTAKCFIFPALYLLFTIPLATFLDFVTIHLRLIASGTALAVLRGFGVDAVQQGTAIISSGETPFSIDVAEPCSGLRSLFALLALTAAYSWYNQPTWLRRAMLFACSIPLAVTGNVVRVLSICLVAAYSDPEFAMGFYHDYSGYIVFIVAILLMVAIGEFITNTAESIKKSHGKNHEDHPESTRNHESDELHARTAPVSAGKLSLCVPIIATILLSLGFLFQAMTPASMIMSPPKVNLVDGLPGYVSDGVRYCMSEKCNASFLLSHLKGGDGRCPICKTELGEISLGEKTILPADTKILKRYFKSAMGIDFLVSVVIGGQHKGSIHRPELCLPAQGFVMKNPCNFDVDGIPFHAIEVVSTMRPSTVLCYTFFNQDGFRTASHTRRILIDTLNRSVKNRVDRWVMVTVNVSASQSYSGFSLDSQANQKMLQDFLSLLFKEL